MKNKLTNPSIIYWLGTNLYLNITNMCSNTCYFCLRKYRNGLGKFRLILLKDPTTEEIINELRNSINRKKWNEIVFCGFGEPLAELDLILELTKWIKKNYSIPVRINTNGQGNLINKGRNVVKELKEAGIDKVSVSLNADNAETYNQICSPRFTEAFENVLKFISDSKKIGLITEITALTIPEVNLTKIRDLSNKIGVEFRIRKYIPFFW